MGTWEHWGTGGEDNREPAPGVGGSELDLSPSPAAKRTSGLGVLQGRWDGAGEREWGQLLCCIYIVSIKAPYSQCKWGGLR